MLIGAVAGVGTLALFSANTTSAGSSFTAGTLAIDLYDTNSVHHADGRIMHVVVSAPGDQSCYTAMVQNTGSLGLIYQWLFRKESSNGTKGDKLAQILQLEVAKNYGTTAAPVWRPWGMTQEFGQAERPRTLAEWYGWTSPDYQDQLDSLDAHEFRFCVSFPLSANNGSQGGEVKVALDVSATQMKHHGLNATFYNGYVRNGNPGTVALQRIDPSIDYDWTYTKAAPEVNQNFFKVEWNGWLVPQVTDDYALYGLTHDGMEVWIDDVKVIDAFFDQTPHEHATTAPIHMEKGSAHKVKVVWYENQGNAQARLSWSGAVTPKQVVPQVVLCHHQP